MTWTELSLNTTPEAVDWIRTLLSGTDYPEDVYVTEYVPSSESSQIPDSESDADRSNWAFTVRLYLPNDGRANQREQTITQQLMALQRTGLTTALERAIVPHKPPQTDGHLIHPIGQRFVVLSPDASYALEGQLPIYLNHSLAFGSGTHPATVLSLRLLERYVLPEMHTLDLGCGSGILSIAMARLGATVLAIDNDRTAVQATIDAVNCNQLTSQIAVQAGSLGQGSELGHWMGAGMMDPVPAIHVSNRFDLIMANVLARIHVALADDFRCALRSSQQAGLIITAGFTTDYEPEVDYALQAAGFEAVDREHLQEWVALVHRLPR